MFKKIFSLIIILSFTINGLSIRLAHPKDAQEIAQLHHDSWHHTYGQLQNIHSPALIKRSTLDYFESYWHKVLESQSPQAFVLIGVEQEKIVGFTSAGPTKDTSIFACAYDAEIYKLYILPQAQDRGIGKQLFNACLKKLIELGFKKVIIRSIKESVKSNRFYEKQKCSYLGEQVSTVDNTVHDIFYGLDLNEKITDKNP